MVPNNKKNTQMGNHVVRVLLCVYVPEDAEDHNSCGERYEGHAVANGVANLHLPEKLALKKKQQHQYKSQ